LAKNTEGVGGKEVEIGLNQPLIFICPFPPLIPQFFYFPLFISVAKKKNYS
jgi:hypothetical protein